MTNKTKLPSDSHSHPHDEDKDSFDTLYAALFCMFMTLLAFALITYKYFRNNPRALSALLNKIVEVFLGQSMSVGAREERAIDAVVSEPIPSCKFLSVYRQRFQGKQLAIEFKALVKNQEDHTTNAALRNVLLNVKQEVVPYDHSRVIVWDRPETLGTDYYNASFIDGYNGLKEYIACQGPSTKCLVSFWHMVWQEGVTCVVMATGLFENAVQQCDKYWVDHTRKHAKHGSIHLWHERSIYLAQLNIRTFRIQREGSCESRHLTHYEMVGFHEECPDPGLLLDVRRRVNAVSMIQPGPVLVHCRCGGGRAAVFVAVDFCLHQLQSEDRVDVYSTVLHLRRFRKNMVRTVSQYKMIYNAVAMYVQCGMTVYPAETLPSAYQVHYACGGDSKHQKLEKEFLTLQSIVPRLSIGDCASGHRVENRSKSRDIMMLPPECARPYLTTADCGDSGTDFINAVYVDGYHSENTYLVTQWPMKRTIADLWRLMFDFKIVSLVFMNDHSKFTRSYPRFWPKEIDQIACYGPISVRYLSYERQSSIIIRTFAIRKPKRHPHLIAQTLVRISEDVMVMSSLVGCEVRQDEVLLKMYQILSSERRTSEGNNLASSSNPSGENYHGHSSGRVDDQDRKHAGRRGVDILSRSLLSVMENVAEWQKRSNSRQPICIISKDGSSRVGLYCAISVCCDQVRVEKEVDVFNAVRLVRKNRPQLVPSLEEYRYIYHFMAEFILLSGSKPDIIISEPPLDIGSCPSNSHRSATASTAVSSSVHGGVYVVASGKGSDTLMSQHKGNGFRHLENDAQAGNSEAYVHNDSKYLCIGHPGVYYDKTQQPNGGILEKQRFPSCHQRAPGSLGEQTQEGLPFCTFQSSCYSNDWLHPSSMHLCLDKTKSESNGRSNLISASLTNGQILSSVTLKPLGDIHRTPSDLSIIRHCPSSQTFLPLPLHIPLSSPSLSSPSPCLPDSSSSSFLTPETHPNTQLCSVLSPGLTSLSHSPGSLGHSSSFFSCNSHLSLRSSSLLGNNTGQYSLGNGGIPSSDLISTILHRPASLNGDYLPATSTQPDQHGQSNHGLSIHKGLSSSLSASGLLRPDMSHIKPCTTNSASTGGIKLIHASYVSLDDSVSGSVDDRDHYSSLDWVEHDGKKMTTCKPPQAKLKQALSSAAAEHGKPTGAAAPITQPSQIPNGETMTSATTKTISSTFNLRQKIKNYRYKTKFKKLSSNPI